MRRFPIDFPASRSCNVFQLLSSIALLICWPALASAQTSKESEAADLFQQRILPIFKERCFECHGERSREGGLRLTNARDAYAENDSGKPAIVPSDVAASHLLERVVSVEPDLQMPPEGPRLTADEINTLERWISEGARWRSDLATKKHWAYIAPTQPNVPAASAPSWAKNAIDHFVAARWNQSRPDEFQPNDRAAPEKLLRRVSFALTGLPPSFTQVQAFKKNPTERAYEAFVDECLKSKAYGQRWAQPWLDLARYADSNGFQADQLRESWAYRDWVIDAINQDLPYDQFAVEQLAGDLLPNATTEQKIATGFHRTVTCNVEAGVHPEANRVQQVFDRVNTTGTVFLGTTLECCQCHNHKYDPFTQDEYYQLFSFFNNTPLEVELKSGVQYDFVGPKMDLPLSEKQKRELHEKQNRLAQLKRRLQQRSKNDQADATVKRLKTLVQQGGVKWVPLKPIRFQSTGGESHEVLQDNSILIGGSLPDTTTYSLDAQTELDRVTGLKLEILTHPSLPGTGPGRGDEVRANFVLNEFSVAVGSEANASDTESNRATEAVELASPLADFSQTKWPISGVIDGKPKTGWAVSPKFFVPHWATFQLKKPLDNSGDKLLLSFELEQKYGRGRTIGRFRVLATQSPAELLGLSDELAAILVKEKPTSKDRKKLAGYLDSLDPERVRLRSQIGELEKAIDAVKPPSTLVMVEMDEARPTFKFLRGEYLSPGKKVIAGVPEVLHEFDKTLPANRLGFAKWMVDPSNPLFARVAVNRWWSAFFGQGIVQSEEDFGIQSDAPTHPELLDWLAVEFMNQGWSRKRIHKLIVMSATFRQSSKLTEASFKQDPNNKGYARGPRRRMTAEMIRDNGLAVSDLLSNKMGGPPVMPYQPDKIWRAVGRNAPKWKAATDVNRFRRGVYVVWRRAAPYPSFVNFDAPDRAACVVKRPSTNTPLQALTLLNDRAYLEMAYGLARRAIGEGDGDATASVTRMVQHSLCRLPTASEVETLVELYRDQRDRFTNDPKQRKLFLKSVGHDDKFLTDRITKSSSAASQPDVNHVAAMTVVANVLLNLDESINY